MSDDVRSTPVEGRIFSMPDNFHDETPLDLDPDQMAVFDRCIGEIGRILYFLQSKRKSGQLTVSSRFVGLGNLETNLASLSKAMGRESDIASEREYRGKDIRAANEEIRQLRRQLGERFPADAFGERVKRISDHLDATWKAIGFCLVDMNIRGSFAFVEFSTFLDIFATTFSDRPASERRERRSGIEALVVDGLELCFAEKDQPDVLDTPGNRAWVLAKLRESYPSTYVIEWHNHSIYGQGDLVAIKKVKVRIDHADLALATEVSP